MRLHSSLISLLFVCAGCGAIAQSSAASSCADLHLVPAPRECTAVKSISIGPAGFASSPAKIAEDEFAAKDLEESLKERGLLSEKTKGSGQSASSELTAKARLRETGRGVQD